MVPDPLNSPRSLGGGSISRSCPTAASTGGCAIHGGARSPPCLRRVPGCLAQDGQDEAGRGPVDARSGAQPQDGQGLGALVRGCRAGVVRQEHPGRPIGGARPDGSVSPGAPDLPIPGASSGRRDHGPGYFEHAPAPGGSRGLGDGSQSPPDLRAGTSVRGGSRRGRAGPNGRSARGPAAQEAEAPCQPDGHGGGRRSGAGHRILYRREGRPLCTPIFPPHLRSSRRDSPCGVE